MYSKSPAYLVAMAAFALVTMAPASGVAAPELMSYQGRLTDNVGVPINGSFSITFTIYDDPVGGNKAWLENHPAVTVTDGLFSVMLGEFTPLTHDAFSESGRYLGITVGADPELTPRTQIGSVGYAYRVATVDSASGGTIEGDVKINANSIANGLEVVQNGLGRGVRIAIDNVFSTESGLAIAMQGIGAGLAIVPDGGPAIDVIGGFGDASVNLPSSSINSNEIVDGAVANVDLASNAITTDKIQNFTILGEDISGSQITSSHLTNEPGAAQSNAAAAFGLTGAFASVWSVTTNVPTSGYVLVMASASATIQHTNGSTTTIHFGVAESAASPDTDQQKEIYISSALPSGTRRYSIAAQKIFPVSAGSNTFYLTARDSAGPGGKTIGDITLSTLFIPTNYGTVQQ